MSHTILADDLSGAMETAATFMRHGWSPSIPLDESVAVPAGASVVISTETRNLPPATALSVLAARAGEIRRIGANLVFKKIDSTMRGPVGAELAAVRETWPERPVFITPANPLVGRVVVDGVLHVNGIRVTQTPFRHDPGWPVMHNELIRLLAASGGPGGTVTLPLAVIRGRVRVRWLREKMAAGRMVFACDAETIDDLRAIVAAAREAHGAPLFTGSSALAAVVAEFARPAANASTVENKNAPPPMCGGTLFVCGSKHPASHHQMRALDLPLRMLTPESFGLASELAADLAARGRATVLCADYPGLPEDALAAMGNIVETVARIALVGTLFVTGGETARALCRRLGGTALELRAEIEPGVIAARMLCPEGARLVITKPGGYGDAQCLVRIREWIYEASDS